MPTRRSRKITQLTLAFDPLRRYPIVERAGGDVELECTGAAGADQAICGAPVQ
jgi:hypothetical protein